MPAEGMNKRLLENWKSTFRWTLPLYEKTGGEDISPKWSIAPGEFIERALKKALPIPIAFLKAGLKCFDIYISLEIMNLFFASLLHA
jgi:hypothetical protein